MIGGADISFTLDSGVGVGVSAVRGGYVFFSSSRRHTRWNCDWSSDVCSSDLNWFKTLTRDNVELVTSTIDRFDETGIVTADGKHRPADIIVVATGFRVTEMAARLNISGRDGKDLREAWANDNPTAFLGLTVPGFPNFFCMLGPNSGPAHGGSVIFQSECQSRYIATCLASMIEQDVAAIDVRQDVLDDYVR